MLFVRAWVQLQKYEAGYTLYYQIDFTILYIHLTLNIITC